jgi:hypothetical protein
MLVNSTCIIFILKWKMWRETSVSDVDYIIGTRGSAVSMKFAIHASEPANVLSILQKHQK